MTDAVERDPTEGEKDAGVPNIDLSDDDVPGAGVPDAEAPDFETLADRLRERGERVRERELDTAIDRLEARGEVTDAERLVLANLSIRLTDALVERWASSLATQCADSEAALDLFADP